MTDTLAEQILFCPRLIKFLDGDVISALVLSQILFWYRPAKGTNQSKLKVFKYGKYWIAKSISMWSTEIGVTEKQMRRAMDVLVAKQVVITEVWKFDGAPMLHCRLAAAEGTRRLFMDEQPILSWTDMPEKANQLALQGISHLPSGASQDALQGKSLTDTTTENTAETTWQLALPCSATLNMTAAEILENDVNAADILKAMKEKQQVQTGTGVKTAILVWKKRTAVEGQWTKDLTGKEQGQLKHAVNAIGDNAVKVLDHALQNWQQFANKVQVDKGAKPAMQPDIGFFCKYSDVAFNLWSNSLAVVKPKQPVQSIAVPITPVQKIMDTQQHEQKASAEDVQATLAALSAMDVPAGVKP